MIENQVYVFLSSIIIGAVLALVFDFFRLTRRHKNSKDLIVYIQDIFYGIIVAICIIISAFITNSGELRGYMFIGYILGAMFYLLLFSKFVLKILGTILDTIEKFFSKIFTFIKNKAKKLKIIKKNSSIKQEI